MDRKYFPEDVVLTTYHVIFLAKHIVFVWSNFCLIFRKDFFFFFLTSEVITKKN